ncbi:hypothetical protein ASL19_09470 [Cylindrospermopsis sp. CR12]|nr:hypothetical protein ASL19_09470 [Cylindrospermopsis sp. CR12]
MLVEFSPPNNNGTLYPAGVSTLLVFDITPLRERAIATPCGEAQLFVGWVGGVGFHPSTQPTLSYI